MNQRVKRASALALTVVLLLAACSPNGTEGQAAPKGPAPSEVAAQQDLDVVKVRTVPAERGALDAWRSAGGTVDALSDSRVAAQASGVVTSVLRRAGDSVREGETVLELDASGARDALRDARLQLETARINLRSAEQQQPENLSAARARVSAASSALEQAARALRANEELYAAGGLARNDLEQGRTAVANAKAELERAQGDLARTERAPGADIALARVQLDQAEQRVTQLERELTKTSVKAPFSGQLADVKPAVGEFVSQGSEAFRLLNTEELRVAFLVPPSDAARLEVGRGVQVSVAGERFEGRVLRNAGVPGEGRLVDVTARLLGAPRVPVGVSALVRYRVNLAEGTLVPSGALQVEGAQSYVFVSEDGHARQREVTVLAESGGRVAVQGLSEGAQVVYPVPNGLQPDARVQVLGAQGKPGGAQQGRAP